MEEKHQWWNTPTAAWGFLLIGVAGGAILAFVSAPVGITVCIIIAVVGVLLLVRAYKRRGIWDILKQLLKVIKSLRGLRLVINPIQAPPTIVKQLEHDSVLWRDTGTMQYGHIYAYGPFCPKDNCLLGIRDRKGVEKVRSDQYNEVIVSNAPYNTFVRGSYDFVILFCHECKTEYTLGANPKGLGQSREEVETLFEAKRRRDAIPN